ncbi:FliG C-terminal domain-containing protein [Bdellovibrio sp. HCB2-146]|uniref:FliG C-terminal domain-containing protein n=1 Tax=Bdellovibrio sp. HCB2-146 TaxID=3394362 RepID=UPI0039BC2CC9
MGMLDRYKKKGGFYQLLQLLETSPIAKRDQFLALIAGESPAWEEALRCRILTINRIYGWDPQYLAEIFSRVPTQTSGYALHGSPQEHIDKVLSGLPSISKRKITDVIAEVNPTPAEKSTCVARILTEVRGYINQGILRLEKVDPDLTFPENIEELLAHSYVNIPSFDSADPAKKDARPSVVGEAEEPSAAASSGLKDENDFLKRKLNQLSSELNAVKHENTVLKDKLSQIKKIA